MVFVRPATTVLAVVLALIPGAVFGQLFGDRTDYAGLRGPRGIIAADFDGDGDNDLAVATQGHIGNVSDSVAILFNAGDGTMESMAKLRTGESPYSLCSSDFDNDGDVDLAVANRIGWSVSVLLNDGAGFFTKDRDYTIEWNPTDVRAADFNGDGRADLVVSRSLATSVVVMINNGGGTFAAGAEYSVGEGSNSVCAADLDGDGCQDIAAALPLGIDILLNEGAGTFSPAGSYYGIGYINYIVSGDVDDDDDIDLVATTIQESFHLFRNSGDGTFADNGKIYLGDSPDQLTMADIDKDNDVDLLISLHWVGRVAVVLNDGAGQFSLADYCETGDGAAGVCAADFDGDCDYDFAAANYDSDDVTLYINRLYTARATIDPDTMYCVDAYAPDTISASILVGDFQNGYTAADVDAVSIRINDSIQPSGISVVIVDFPPDSSTEWIKLDFDPRSFIAGYGALWGTETYPYSVTGEYTDETAWGAGGEIVIIGFLPGDADGNGYISTGDPIRIVYYLYRENPPIIYMEPADANGSGYVDMGDVAYLLNFIFRNGPPPQQW